MRIVLDVVDECPKEQVEDWAERYNVVIVSVNEHGPAGGNPEYTFEGEEEDLRAMYEEYDDQCAVFEDYVV